jgi:dimethylglycine dehydrogenase
MRTHARVVIIGGGAVGCSTLYHLAKLGWTDAVLLERDELTSGSTWHAAGNCPNFSTSWNLLKLHRYSTALYARLADEVGYAINRHPTGSIRLAHTSARVDEFRHVASQARAQGIEFELLSPAEVHDRHPFLELDDVRVGLWDPYDGDIDPAQMTQALAKGARDLGAEVHRQTRVTAIAKLPSGEWRIETTKGAITAEYVVNAGGYRGGEVAAMIGEYLPIVTLSHQFLITEEIPELRARGENRVPIVRDPDVSYYLRQERFALLLGPYENTARAHWLDGIPDHFANELFPDDLGRIESYILAACERTPILGTVGIQSVINGPIPYAPDGNPLISPARGERTFFHCCAFTFGIVQAGGAGKCMAEWLVHGAPEWDMWAFDGRRYGDYAGKEFALAKAIETYENEYGVGYPQEEREAARPLRCSPAYPLIKARGARFGARGGWERAVYFPQAGDPTDGPEWSFRRPFWHTAVARECKAVQERVAILDLPGFTKFEVTGSGAGAWLDTMVAGRVPKKDGRTALNYFCADDGGIVSEMTISHLEPGRFWLLTTAAGERHDEDWLRDHLPAGGRVQIANRSAEFGTLIVVGPSSRDVLAAVTTAPLDNTAFPWLSVRSITVAGVAVVAMRVNYVGELGWELHVPMADIATVYTAVRQAGERYGIADFGLYAMDSLRLEKGYRGWKGDLTRDYTPFTASLDRFVVLDKPGGFIGQAALRAEAAAGPKERFVPLIVDATDADAAPVSIVFHRDTVVGLVTSGGYGYRIGRSIALAYVRADLALPGTELEIEILGTRQRAFVGTEPLYDPDNLRLRA